MHLGRSWTGHPLEDLCPCPKAPCGLVDGSRGKTEFCREHALETGKTMRQIHDAEHCPGVLD